MVLDDVERLVESTQTLKPGSTPRKKTAVGQGVVALLLLGVGIFPIYIRYDVDHVGGSWDQRPLWIAGVLDNVGSGVWSSVVFLITAFVGFNSGKSRSMISLYFALCLFSVFVSMAVCGATVGSIVATVGMKQNPSYVCGEWEVRIWCDDGRDRYDYRGSIFEDNTADIDCIQYRICQDEIQRVSNLHLPFYAIMLMCAVVEFVCAIFGASWTCVGLCKCTDCCKPGDERQPQTQQMMFHGMNAGGQWTNLGNIPQNVGYPQPMFAPGYQTVGPVTSQQVNAA